MARHNNLQVIGSCIEELMAQDGLESEQIDALETAMKAVSRFRSNTTPSDSDVFRLVRIVAEKIATNFIHQK